MDGYVFFEVDNMGNPIYGDKMKELLNCEKEAYIVYSFSRISGEFFGRINRS